MNTYYGKQQEAERRFEQDEMEDYVVSKNKVDFEIKTVDLQKELDTLWGIPTLSECCGKPLYEDTDICTGCKEHN